MLQSGDKAPDITLQTLEGQPFPLADTWGRGQNALLIFLRHLG